MALECISWFGLDSSIAALITDLLLRTGLVGGVLTAALLVPASMLGLPDAASADCCMRCRVASAASAALAAALLAASSSLSPATTDPITIVLDMLLPSALLTSRAHKSHVKALRHTINLMLRWQIVIVLP